MMNVHNRRAAFASLPGPGLIGGIVPVGPSNSVSMLHDYVSPDERMVACPNQDVVYGFGILALDEDAVVVQVPDFGDRFWVYQVGDQRTDGFAKIGQMYASKPGFYLLVGPDWSGTPPAGIQAVFRSSTNTGYVIPRVFLNDTREDRQAVLPFVNEITMYPLSKYDGKMKVVDWTKSPTYPAPDGGGEAETKWVKPDSYFDDLPKILDEVPPLPGEEALYAQLRALCDAMQDDPNLPKLLRQVAADAEEVLVNPLFEFRNYGLPLKHNWTTVTNGGQFGADYLTRLAVAKSNIFVNQSMETRYFYQDLDAAGKRLTGARKYSVTFQKGYVPPVRGFWSLTLYNERHFFSKNGLSRYSLGTKNADLKYAADGSLTIYVQADPPDEDKRANWLPAPSEEFSLYIRAYWPNQSILDGTWTPPPVVESS